jgi:hypothetical protein
MASEDVSMEIIKKSSMKIEVENDSDENSSSYEPTPIDKQLISVVETSKKKIDGPVIRYLVKNSLTKEKITIRKKPKPIIRPEQFIQPPATQFIEFRVPSQSRMDKIHTVTLYYEYPKTRIACSCGQDFGIIERFHCQHIQSIINQLVEDYLMNMVKTHKETRENRQHDRSRKRQRAGNSMAVDSDLSADVSASGNNEVVVDFLSSMLQKFSF